MGDMVEPRSTAAHATVVFLRIREFPHRSATERAGLKSRLDALVGTAIAALQVEERVLLDAPDGAAVVILGNPRGALSFASRALEAASGLPLSVALNYGPVRVVQDGETAPIVAGDGIGVASAIADSGAAGQVLASRSFREHLLSAAPDRGRHLAPAGKIVDAGDRTHTLYFADDRSLANRRRRALVLTAMGAVGIVALGILGRHVTRKAKSASIEFEIKPEGEVLVDGVSKGIAPPLAHLEIAAGKHTIEVRYPRFPPLVMDIDLQPGEKLRLKHTFATAPAPPPAPSSKPPASPKSPIRKFFDRFKP
jgi:class 3 adenylate cyclase